MLCERCKIREANIQYTEILNGVKTEHHLCAQCARELDFGPYSAIFDSEFPLGKLLSGLLGVGDVHEEDKTHQIVCPTCKTSYEEFVKDSRFGCPDCYGVFDLLISDNIKQLQGSDIHKGKRPAYNPRTDRSMDASSQAEDASVFVGSPDGTGGSENQAGAAEQIRILEARLREAIRKEEYEAAARYRDKIKELREEIGEC